MLPLHPFATTAASRKSLTEPPTPFVFLKKCTRPTRTGVHTPTYNMHTTRYTPAAAAAAAASNMFLIVYLIHGLLRFWA